MIFELKPIPKEAIKELLKKAVYDTDRGMGAYNGTIDEDALDFLADISGGDARHALNAIELGIMTTEPSADGKIHITLDVAQQCIQKRAARYDKNGDNHYDTISAFIKSMRGSDPDAAVYYLARMLNAGESVTFIARRIMICASEDVGNADPQALVVAVNASLAVDLIKAAFKLDAGGITAALNKLKGAYGDYGKDVGKAFNDAYTAEMKAGEKSNAKKSTKKQGKSAATAGVTIPEVPTPTVPDVTSGTAGATASKKTGGSSDSGGKINNVSIHVDKLVERLEIHTANLQESAERVKDVVAQALLSALNDTNLAME